jgi:hypothetical protein
MGDDIIIQEIKAGRRVFNARFARRDNEEGTAPDWSEKRSVTLFVRLREKPFKNHPAGEILELTPERMDWASYSERDYVGWGEFLAEEWRMQLFID